MIFGRMTAIPFGLFLALMGRSTGMCAEISQVEILLAEKEAIDSRLKIRSGVFRWSVRRPTYVPSRSVEKSVVDSTVYLLGARERQDSVFTTQGHRVRLVSLRHPQHVISGKGTPELLESIEKFSKEGAGNSLSITDVRKLGLIINGIDSLSNFALEEELLSTRRRNLSANPSNDASSWDVRYEWQGQNGNMCQAGYVLDRAEHKLPRSMFVNWVDGEQHFEDTIATEWAHDSSKTTWFPSRIDYRRRLNGELNIEELTEVTFADFSDPDEKQFDLGGLGLERGQRVMIDDEVFYWQGNQASKTPPQDERSIPFRPRTLLLLLSMILSIIGLSLWLRQKQ